MTKKATEIFTPLKDKSVLVTGSAGYIGSELMKRFHTQDIRCLGIDKSNVDGSGELRFNLCDRNRTLEVFDEFSPDYVIHCGTHSAVAYRQRFLESFEEDACAMSNILHALTGRPGTRLMLLSSSYVYSGLEPGNGVHETDTLRPAHNFGVAKSFFEQYALRNHPGSVIFRLSSVFGGGDRPCPNAIADMAREFCERGSLTVWGAGSRMMQYVYIDDVIAYMIHGLGIEPGLYNLGGNEYVSISKTATVIAAFFKAEVCYLRDKKEGETLPFMDNEKLKRATGVDIYAPLADALRRYLVDLPCPVS